MYNSQIPSWRTRALPNSQTRNGYQPGGAATYAQNENLFISDTSCLDQHAGQIVDPVPVISYINRLHESHMLTTVPTMKEVNRLPASLQSSFGDKQGDWYAHINKLELDAFQKHAFNSMQCYFAIKASLKGAAQRALYNLESQLETPKWANFMPSWFMVEAEDWMALAKNTPFCSLRYSLRCALIYRYFHHLFQCGDPEQVFEKFRKAVQGAQESVEDWILRLKELCNAVKRYRANVPFHRFAEQVLVGSKSSSY